MLPPTTNRLIRTAKLEMDAAGTLAGEVQELRWEQLAVDRREQLMDASGPAERRRVLENFLGAFLGSIRTPTDPAFVSFATLRLVPSAAPYPAVRVQRPLRGTSCHSCHCGVFSAPGPRLTAAPP